MSVSTIIIIVLILMLFGVLPSWPHSSSWGYGPSGGLGLVLVVLLDLLLMGKSSSIPSSSARTIK